ncbi:MAG: hypothetical protein FJ301_06220 [Planctomycetes bacterium]|nr:hypothetical protein [Planctomycetota bacterium]
MSAVGPTNQLGALAAPTPLDGERAPQAPVAPGFEALLDKLGRHLAPARSPEQVQTADDLRDAVADADASFTTAMDLRRQLEEAFKQQLQ